MYMNLGIGVYGTVHTYKQRIRILRTIFRKLIFFFMRTYSDITLYELKEFVEIREKLAGCSSFKAVCLTSFNG